MLKENKVLFNSNNIQETKSIIADKMMIKI